MIAPASRKIGKYEIVRKLGRGGMADVYLANDTESGQTVALKLIEHSSDADTCSSIEAEMRGATLQARLADVDPRVVQVFGAGDLEDFFHVAMEYVDGQDLAELMRHGKLELAFGIGIVHDANHGRLSGHGYRAGIDAKLAQEWHRTSGFLLRVREVRNLGSYLQLNPVTALGHAGPDAGAYIDVLHLALLAFDRNAAADFDFVRWRIARHQVH